MKLNHYREPFDGLPNPERYPENGKPTGLLALYEAAYSLASEYATELERIRLDEGAFRCPGCNGDVNYLSELEDGTCHYCRRDDDCQACGDGASGSCPACAM